MPQSEPVPSERALIPVAPRGLMRFSRSLSMSPRLALGLTASAVGTVFVKRLVELIAEDVYHRVRRQPADRLPVSQRPDRPRWGRRLRARRAESLPARHADTPQDVTPLPASGGILWVRIVQVWRILPADRNRD